MIVQYMSIRRRTPAAAALTALALTLAWAAPVPADEGRVLIENVRGYTPGPLGVTAFSALEVGSDGRVAAVHTVAPAALPAGTRRIDGAGRTLIPGLIDAHAHLLSEAQRRNQVDLVGSDSLEEAQRRVAAYLDRRGRGDGWVLGRGWNQVLWPGKAFPTAADLDAVTEDRPVYLRRIDGHAAWANTRALELAGIDAATPDPQGGQILRDEAGRATGILVDRAMDLVSRHIPESASRPSDQDLRDTVAALNAEGLTGMHQAGISVADARRLDALYRDTALPLRLYLMLDADADLATFGAPWIGRHDDRLTVRAVKLYADGALGSRGAALLAPYSDEPGNRGLLFQPDADLFARVKRVHDAGYQAGIHAIGDAANRQALDAIEHALAGGPNHLRHRIEHVQVLHPDDLPRLARLGVIASMQPVHATSDMNMAEDRVGPDRIKGAYAWRSLLDRGTVISSGSDFPVELSNPFHGLHAAVARRDQAGRPPGGWYRNEAMTRAEALTSMTLAAAYAAHQEADLGSLARGKWADFLILDRDIMTVPEQDLFGTRVLETWVGGVRVHRAGD